MARETFTRFGQTWDIWFPEEGETEFQIHKRFEVGDDVWVIAGFRGSHMLAIKCKIEFIDDASRKKHPDAYIFYDVDEPIGHLLDSDELFVTRKEAEEELLENYLDMEQYVGTGKEPESSIKEALTANLKEYREQRIKSLRDNWTTADFEIAGPFRDYPEKEENVDWFNITHILEK